jgi:CO dehydrogenase/acetyl-CoA synthase beta subunit
MAVKAYTVYRYDYIREVKEPIGKVIERRSKDRRNNIEALLRLAQRLYSTSSLDSHIVIIPE